jgi:predicted nucleic acid-binding protein
LIIADTGPLVAYLDRSDQHHAWAKQVMDTFTEPLHTCDAVLAEATFLLQRGGIAAGLPMQMIERGVLQTGFDSGTEAHALRALLERYDDVRMSLADACVVRMSELQARAKVWTTDSDFTIYRRNRRGLIPLIMPSD